MLDRKMMRQNKAHVRQKLINRGFDESLFDDYLALDEAYLSLNATLEKLRQERNDISKQIGERKRNNENTDDLFAHIPTINAQLDETNQKINELSEKIEVLLNTFPNLPHDSVPVGHDETDNIEMYKWGEPKPFVYEVKPHEELGVDLDIFDFSRGAKVSGSRFVFYKGLGARLERALIQFMLDVHVEEHGYTELLPPQLVTPESAYATGQLPKFEDDLFQTTEGHYLIPTAEVPVTNYHRDEILPVDQLPKYYVAYSACFRSEAGSAGRDTKGIIRQHQFNKVELVKLTTPETSYEELETITQDAERILQRLELPYRKILLCTGDAGFGSAKTYDLEVWFPSQNQYREISSATNFEDFQGRRAQIRLKRTPNGPTEYVHTLNASGLAIGRTVAAILENYQNEDGTVTIPKILVPYMHGHHLIQKRP